MANKWVYMFSEGDMTMRNLLGGKGANLAEMTALVFLYHRASQSQLRLVHSTMRMDVRSMMRSWLRLWKVLRRWKRSTARSSVILRIRCLVSVRSGARASMPGMMDTILNLGLNDDVVAAMIAGNPDPAFERFVYDSYRRFIQMFSDVVMEVGKKYFEQLIDKMKEEKVLSLT